MHGCKSEGGLALHPPGVFLGGVARKFFLTRGVEQCVKNLRGEGVLCIQYGCQIEGFCTEELRSSKRVVLILHI